MEKQVFKRRVILTSLYVVLFAIIAFLLYLMISPASTCFDNKKNQAEKGIDCGGPCSPCKDINDASEMQVKETAVALGGNGSYDVVAKILNPNDSIGAKSFKYVFTLKDSSGSTVATREGTNFILPSDSKYIAELGIQVAGGVVPTIAEVSILDPQWDRLPDIGKPQLGVYSKKFDKAPMGEGSEAEGVLRNESGYDLKDISIVIVLRDENGKIIGVNTTVKNSVRSKEERDFRLTWPYALSGSVQSMDVDAQSNVFDEQNFSEAR